jgi:hypothetical protein
MPTMRTFGRGRIGAQKGCRLDKLPARPLIPVFGHDLSKARESRRVRIARPTFRACL